MSDADLQELTRQYVRALRRHNQAKGMRLKLDGDLHGAKRRVSETQRLLTEALDSYPATEPLLQARKYAEAVREMEQTETATASARAEEETAATAVQQVFASLKGALP